MNRMVMMALMLGALFSGYAVAGNSLGEKIANQGSDSGATPCSSCHGEDGMGNPDAGFPKLAGLHKGYIEKQIRDFQSGVRNNPLMQGMVAMLTDEEIKAVSEYMFKLKPKATKVSADPALVKQGEEIAKRGLWNKEIPACSRCHGADGNGIGKDFPGLAGQHADYIETQIGAWKSEDRKNDPNALMMTVAKRLGEQEAKAVAAYYSQLPAAK